MRKRSGFTLIEMLVVIGVVAIALPAIFAIIFAIIRQQARVYALKQIKREGDFVLNRMEDTIRNSATGIFTNSLLENEVCDISGLGTNPYPSDGSEFFFEDKFGNWFQYRLDQSTVASRSGVLPTANLTTPAVQVQNFSISCFREASYSPPTITISFNISYNGAQFQEQIANLHYQTQIQMKNY